MFVIIIFSVLSCMICFLGVNHFTTEKKIERFCKRMLIGECERYYQVDYILQNSSKEDRDDFMRIIEGKEDIDMSPEKVLSLAKHYIKHKK